MSLWTCLDCLTRYAVGLSRCPHCASEIYSEEELPKTTVSDGGSNARAELEPGYVKPEGDDQSLAGISTSASSEPSSRNMTTGSANPPSPAPMTENPSPKPRGRKTAQDVSSSAGLTDGSTQEITSAQSSPDVNASGGITLPLPGSSNG